MQSSRDFYSRLRMTASFEEIAREIELLADIQKLGNTSTLT
jgi:hypothetical protein